MHTSKTLTTNCFVEVWRHSFWMMHHGQRALKGRACGRTAGNWWPDLPWSQVYQSLLVTSCCSTTMECISGCTYCFIVFDDEDKGRLTKIQRVKKTKVKTTRALLR